MMHKQTIQRVHPTRAAFDEELKVAGIALSPFPFERTFDSFVHDPRVILYRCIEGDFNHRYDNKDWSLNPQHALEYSRGARGSTATLLMTQFDKVDLCKNVNFYSRQGDKIGLAESPDPGKIAKTSLTDGRSFLDADWLRCMRKVIRVGVDPESSADSLFASDFKPEDLQFKSVLYEWQLGISMAHSDDRPIPIPPEVRSDYNARRGERPKL
jgi:hypothetical protein